MHGLELQMLFLSPPQPSPPIPVLLTAAHPGCSAGFATVRRRGHPRGTACGSRHLPPAKPTRLPGHTPHISLLLHGPSEDLSSSKCLSLGSVNRDTASWEKNPTTDEMKAWLPLSKSSQESRHKAWVNFHASGTDKALPPNTHLQQDLKRVPKPPTPSAAGRWWGDAAGWWFPPWCG